jgi:diadenosine tetraphosphatase ApaH/serine/threonine PP2A family protein phosphatase
LKALLYDVHGNLPALEAVLEDAQGAGAQSYVLGGDYALFGAFPAECLERLDGLEATWIRGNTDRWLAGTDVDDLPDTPLVSGSIEFCRERLGAQRCAELGRLAPVARLDEALICHASPHSDMRSFLPQPADSDAELLTDTGEPVVVFGHTHVQFAREHIRSSRPAASDASRPLDSGQLLVNPGSVGMPFDGDPRAAYALWSDPHELQLRRVEYDHRYYAAQLFEIMGPALGEAVDTLVRRVEQAEVTSQ